MTDHGIGRHPLSRRRSAPATHTPILPCSHTPLTALPAPGPALDRWILNRRPARNVLDPWRPYAFLSEPEVAADGETVDAVTIFLTNRECPFRCVMCDLWQNTLEETVPPGAIAAQIRYALERLPASPGARRCLKLYNAGSFFDPRAIPPTEYSKVARLAAAFERVVVECHPGFIGQRCVEIRDLLREAGGMGVWECGSVGVSERLSTPIHPYPHTRILPGTCRLEIAIGLETAHEGVLARLNKRMTLAQFRRAAEFLAAHEIGLRVFILVRPPWLSEAEGVEWAKRSLDFAFGCGASVCSLIPTRAGNGAMDALEAAGEFAPPCLGSVEAAVEYGLELARGRVFADLWEIRRFATCPVCSEARIARLEAMNRTQQTPPPVVCSECDA